MLWHSEKVDELMEKYYGAYYYGTRKEQEKNKYQQC